MGFIKKAVDFASHPTQSRTMGILVMLVFVSAVSLTVIVSQQQQSIRQRAAEKTCDQQRDEENAKCSSAINQCKNACYKIIDNEESVTCQKNCDDKFDECTNNAKNEFQKCTDKITPTPTPTTTPTPTPSPTLTPTPTSIAPTGPECKTKKRGYCKDNFVNNQCQNGYELALDGVYGCTAGACCVPVATLTPTTIPTSTPIPASECETKFNGICMGVICTPQPQYITLDQHGCPSPYKCCVLNPAAVPTPTPVNNALLVLALNAQDVPTATDSPLLADLAFYNLTTNNLVAGAPKTQSFAKIPVEGKQYSANISLTNLQQNKYFIVARKGNMIAKAVFTVSGANETITVPTTTLVFGDINNDNDINILDYNAFRDCWKKTAADSCGSSDFDKNGAINQFDYNTYLRGFATWIKEGK